MEEKIERFSPCKPREYISEKFAAVVALLIFTTCCLGQKPPSTRPGDIVIRNATIMTAGPQGTLEHATVWLHAGKIEDVGQNISIPAGATIIDGSGKYVTPGIIDPHSHIAVTGDENEMSDPVTAGVRVVDSFDGRDASIYRALTGGVTTEMILHGSANVIGGQSVIVKNKFGLAPEQMLFPAAPRSIKFSSGENPKAVYGRKGQLPMTRMGEVFLMREAFEDAKVYRKEWTEYEAKRDKGDTSPPRRDLKLDALSDVLSGNMYVQIHCYRADEMLTEIALAKEYGYKLRALHHALEAYKISDKIAASNVAIATFADWWGYKFEVQDAIPWNAVMNMRQGVRVAIKSDSSDQIRRLNQEAAKTIHYGGATEEEAIRMITINPAWIIGVQDRVGSIEIGKDADVVIWNRDPLSVYARAEKVFIEGDLYFDITLPGYGLTKFNGPMYSATWEDGAYTDDGGTE